MERPEMDLMKFKHQNVISIMIIAFLIVLGIVLLFHEIPEKNKDLLSQLMIIIGPLIGAIIYRYSGKETTKPE